VVAANGRRQTTRWQIVAARGFGNNVAFCYWCWCVFKLARICAGDILVATASPVDIEHRSLADRARGERHLPARSRTAAPRSCRAFACFRRAAFAVARRRISTAAGALGVHCLGVLHTRRAVRTRICCLTIRSAAAPHRTMLRCGAATLCASYIRRAATGARATATGYRSLCLMPPAAFTFIAATRSTARVMARMALRNSARASRLLRSALYLLLTAISRAITS